MGGKVPKSYYTKKLEVPENGPKREYTMTVIKKGEKLTLDFIVAEEGCFLRYEIFFTLSQCTCLYTECFIEKFKLDLIKSLYHFVNQK